MKNLLVGLCLVLSSFSSFSQKDPIKFGDIPLEDLKMTIYGPDSSAAAVILADYGQTSMNYHAEKGFSLLFERITRIKILNKSGLEWGDFSIPLYHDNSGDEKLSGLKAVTYNLENEKVVETKLKSDGIFKEKYDNNFNVTKFTLSNVKEGSIVEVAYKIESGFIFNFQDWQFQHKIPVRWSEYRALIPEYFNYDKYMQGYVLLHMNESATAQRSMNVTFREDMVPGRSLPRSQTEKFDFIENKFRWVAKDVPAFKEEPYMTTYKDFISKINFELGYTKYPNQPIKPYMGTWDDINKTYSEAENFYGEINGNGFLKKTVEEITSGATSPEEKITRVHQYVRDNFQWDGSSRKFITTSLRKVFDEKKGNSAEINLLMASMLEKLELDVHPVLISTRDNGFIRESIPASTQFNHTLCLVKVGDKKILLDATEKLLPVGVLPERCLNGNGFVVSKNAPFSWVPLTSPSKSKVTTAVDVQLSDGGEFNGKITVESSGYYGQKSRKEYLSKGEADYLKALIADHQFEISNSKFENVKEVTASFKQVHDLSMKEHATVSGNMIYFNPLLVSRLKENPFKLDKREYPVDFGSPFDKVHIIKITIPQGYNVEELPESKALTMSGNMARFLYNITQAGNVINVTSYFQINRSLYTQEEYTQLREFYAQAVAKQAEQIVLKKL